MIKNGSDKVFLRWSLESVGSETSFLSNTVYLIIK